MALCLSGCVEKGAAIDEAFVNQNVLSAEPTPKHAVNADLGGKVVYLGADLDKEQLAAGDKLTIVHYWKIVQPPGSEWRVFTHVEGSGKDWINADGSKLRANHPPERWKAGEILRDEQTVTIRPDWSSPFAAVHVGLYRKGSSSPKDRMMVVTGPGDGQGRVLAAKVPVTPGARPVAAGSSYVVRKASGPIVIDGKADEPSWAQAAVTASFKDAEGGQKVGADTTARLLWDDQHLYVWMDVKDPDVYSSFAKRDDPLWKEDVVEAFIDANGDRRGYIELQVNPNNAVFDAWFPNPSRQGADFSFDAGMKTAVVVDGTKDNRDDTDKGWQVEMAIPLAAVKGKDASMAVTIPPRPGDRWRMNLVRVEKGKDKKSLTASSWAAITIQDFHAIDRLNEVVFGDDKGAVPVAEAKPVAKPAEAAKGE